MVDPAVPSSNSTNTTISLRNRRKAQRAAKNRKSAYACCVNLALAAALVLVLFSNAIWAGLSGHNTRQTQAQQQQQQQQRHHHSGYHHHHQPADEAKYQVDEGEIEQEEEEEIVEEKVPAESEWAYVEPEEEPYDPAKEDPIDKCRRDPTWRRSVNYQECQHLMKWTPRDTWWRLDKGHNEFMLQGHEDDIHQCIARRFNTVYKKKPDELPWSHCTNEKRRDESCRVGQTRVTGYYRNYQEGEAVMFANAFTEQEAFALRALHDCMFVYLPKELPWWEDRKFGGADRYDVVGGNEVTFVQGMIQVFTPGIAATLYRNFGMAYKEGNWAHAGFQNLGYPPPSTLGIRTAEALAYHNTGQLGTHTDSDSVFTIAIHLCEEESYEGGNFRLGSEHAFFKVPRLGALSFFADSDHGVTKVKGGDRNIFVVELWENDDAPPGTPRPDFHPWDVHMQKRWPIVVGAAEEYLDLEAYE